MQKGVACIKNLLPPKDLYSEHPSLTEKEMDLLILISKGFTNKEIGTMIPREWRHGPLGRRGVSYRVRTLLKKFGASNRTELVACAFRAGIIE